MSDQRPDVRALHALIQTQLQEIRAELEQLRDSDPARVDQLIAEFDAIRIEAAKIAKAAEQEQGSTRARHSKTD